MSWGLHTINRLIHGNPNSGEAFETPDPSQVQWDPDTGMPIGLKGPPSSKFAQQYQWRANEINAQRNAGLRRSAMTFLDQGARLSESFRPGGFASLMSGIYQDRSRTALASQTEPQDMLAGWRSEQDFNARKAARRAGYLQLAGSALGAIGQGLGAAAGAGALRMPSGGGGVPGAAGSTYGGTMGGLGPTADPAAGTFGASVGGAMGGATGYASLGPGGQPASPGSPGARPMGAPAPVGGEEGATGDELGGGAGPGAGAGADPYSLAQIIHTFNTQDGFDDGIQTLTRHMLAKSMAHSGLMEDMVA